MHSGVKPSRIALLLGAIQTLIFTSLRILYAIFIHPIIPTRRIATFSDKVVVITGCDTGFGKLTSIALSNLGFEVYAGCLTDAGRDALSRFHIRSAILDVTNDVSVQAFVKFVEDTNRKRGVYCLINNAGIARGMLLDWTPVEIYKAVMEVNFFGMVRCCKEFLPLLKLYRNGSCNARVINITSLAGLMPTPGFSAYGSSKHAAEGFSDCLRIELKSWDIDVVTVCPAFFRTAMTSTEHLEILRKEVGRHMTKDTMYEYGVPFLTAFESFLHLITKISAEPSPVIRTIENAVTARSPNARYTVGPLTRFVYTIMHLMPISARDYLVARQQSGFGTIHLPRPQKFMDTRKS